MKANGRKILININVTEEEAEAFHKKMRQFLKGDGGLFTLNGDMGMDVMLVENGDVFELFNGWVPIDAGLKQKIKKVGGIK